MFSDQKNGLAATQKCTRRPTHALPFSAQMNNNQNTDK